MTMPMSVYPRRPGNFPTGSAQGLVAEAILTALVPFLVLQSLVPVLRNGNDIWVGCFLPVIALGAITAAVIVIGILQRASWLIYFVFFYGWIVIAAFVMGLSLGLVLLSGMLPDMSPDLKFIHYVNIIEWVIFSPLAWLVLRTLRLRYWQPGTKPEEWETPEEFGPPRTLLARWIARKE